MDLVSDVHLHPQDTATVQAWEHYVRHTPANAIFILGDFFEVWVGDDILSQSDSFEAQCARTLAEAAQRRAIFVMHGNRDFLLGAAFMQACAAQALPDPTALTFGDQRWLLLHGDTLCLEDTDYQRFRAEVRAPDWQAQFLAKPLEERITIARSIRCASEARKAESGMYSNIDMPTARALLQDFRCTQMVHGHTHQPADHDLGDGLTRYVLSDWDAQARPARGQVLRLSLTEDGSTQVQRLDVASSAAPRY